MLHSEPIRSDAGPEPCCDRRSAEVLEFAVLLDKVASLAMSPPGAARVRALRPVGDISLVSRRLRRLGQLKARLEQAGRPSLQGIGEVGPLLAQLRVEGAWLTPDELGTMAGFLRATAAARRFLTSEGQDYDELDRLANAMVPMPELARRLAAVVGPGNTVASGASPELAQARRRMARAREGLQRRLGALVHDASQAGLFSDTVVTQRAGRFVVPVKAEAKGRLAGIIHDTSATGATCFVEPLEAVEANNQLALLRQKEREEEQRVLARAARDLRAQLPVLRENLAALAKLDCLLAQAEFCRRLDTAAPRLAAGGEVLLNGARHPLLAWRQVTGGASAVPINLELSSGVRVMVISGANAGGKTAALKTVGLITLMVMCGMEAPLEPTSRVAVFDQVLADGGDEQDLQGELSTFTAHAGRLAHICRRAGRGSLVLIDELGASTDPGEGSALGMAVLDHLAAAGVRVLVTTHYHRLKAYGAARDFATNVSVAFDRRTGRPTYQLHYGQAGFSDALAVSRGLGFPAGVVAAAEGYLEDSERATAALLKEAQAAAQKAQQELTRARRLRLEAEGNAAQARRQLEQARRQRAGALGEGKRRVREVAGRMQKRLEELLEQVAEQQAQGAPPKAGRVRQELYLARRQALAEVERVVSPPPAAGPGAPPPLKAGDRVMVASLGQAGVLEQDLSPERDAVAVSVGVAGVRVMVPPAEISPLAGGKKPAGTKITVQATAGDGLDLDLVGLRVDEALPLVDKALDQAILAGRKSLKVIHGVGTGRLRQAVRRYLSRHPQVVAANPGLGRSAAAVTVAELRD